MKFTITSAFLALTFGTVCGGKINPQGEVEDEVFWERFMQTLDSMPAKATDAPTEASETPTAAPTYGEVSYAPTDGTGAPSDSPTPEGTSSGTTDCNSIATVLCGVPEFSTLCDLIDLADLVATLSVDDFTIFAPVNAAFDSLPEEVADALAEDDGLLTDVILYHAVPGYELRADGLLCDGDVTMANFEDTTTVCTSEGIFQVGPGNDPDAYPQIIARDGVACNGIIHAIDEIILPIIDIPSNETEAPTSSNETLAPTEVECGTISEVLCALPQFEILCALVGDAGLSDALGGVDDFTLFAPVNTAFESLTLELADSIISDMDLLELVILSHAVSGDLFSTDLVCGGEIAMVSGAETTTVCEDGMIFQVGAGNSADSIPQIISVDGVACNGIIHAIDKVILPTLL